VESATPGASAPTRDVYLTLADPRFGGFRFTVVYTGSAATTDPAMFDNTDTFFLPGASPSQPATSFMSMWMATHAADVCEYVAETGDSDAATRTYEVGFTSPGAGATGQAPASVYFAYSVADDTWAETKTDLGADDPSLSHPAEAELDTATAVAKALPAFEMAGVAQEPDGPWVEIVRHRTYRAVRLAVDTKDLEPGDPSDAMQQLFDGDHARAKSFLVMWTSRHPGTIIETIAFDPDFSGDAQLIEVDYSSGTAADVGVFDRQHYVRFRYHPSSHSWVSAK
jgi:hypothetical protein